MADKIDSNILTGRTLQKVIGLHVSIRVALSLISMLTVAVSAMRLVKPSLVMCIKELAQYEMDEMGVNEVEMKVKWLHSLLE